MRKEKGRETETEGKRVREGAGVEKQGREGKGKIGREKKESQSERTQTN